jgi:hypothetical protein
VGWRQLKEPWKPLYILENQKIVLNVFPGLFPGFIFATTSRLMQSADLSTAFFINKKKAKVKPPPYAV